MKKLMFGIIFIAAGTLLLGFSMGYLDPAYKPVVFSWDMLLIALGLIHVFSNEWPLGLLLLVAGGLLLCRDLAYLSVDFEEIFWASVFITIGIIIIFKRSILRRRFSFKQNEYHPVNSDEIIEEINFFGGSKKKFLEPAF